ncbi:MAG: HU family DNA-binding protein [Christensenellales bacterium]
MNKNDLIKGISEKSSLTQKEAKEALFAIAGLIKESLSKGDEVKLTGFGKFEVKQRSKRTTINPQTKQKIIIPATRVASFKAGKELKQAVTK